MKTLPLLLATLLIRPLASAQSLEQSFRNLMAEFKANPYAYVQANYAPDLRFIAGHNGEFRTKDRMIAPTTKVEDIQATDLKFFESGDLAVVSGINTTRYAIPNGQLATYKDAFTYTFQKISGKWKHVAMQHTRLDYDIPGQTKADEEAIRKVIEGETSAFFDADYKTYRAYWAKIPHVSFLYSQGLFVGDALWKKMDEVWANRKPQPMKITRSDWNIRVKGEAAFVTLHQLNENMESKIINESFEEKYLEKINGEWKLVNNTVWSLPRK